MAGRYEIVRELGRGGMGVVYLAKHIQMERLCALKMVRSDSLVNPEAASRFHREARNASRIAHPNVVAVYDFGETPEGSAFLAMEYIEGRSLDVVLREGGAMPPRRAGRIVWQIANGLNVAHELQIVHRDLKPANIMLTRYRSWEDFVKVVDFGIAKALGAPPGSTLTGAGLVIGTPGYMSPEQWDGAEVDHRSDIFSLAMIAVHLLAGSAPPNRPSGPSAGSQILEAIPAAANWPEDLKAVLCQGLAPVPEERYSTVTEFATAFVATITRWAPPEGGVREPWDERLGPEFVTEEPVREPAGAGTEPTRPRRARGLWVAAGVGGIVVVGGLIWIGFGSERDPETGSGAIPVSQETTSVQRDSAPPPSPGPTSPLSVTPAPAPVPPNPPGVRPPITRPARWADSAAALGRVFDLDQPVADSARRVVARAGSLLRQPLPDSARVEVSYRLAEAQLFLGADSAACAVLRDIQPVSERSGYFARSIDLLLSRHCR